MTMYSKAKQLYSDSAMQNAFLNACDCMHYGYGKTYWQDCGIDEQYRDLVWQQARYFVAEEED